MPRVSARQRALVLLLAAFAGVLCLGLFCFNPDRSREVTELIDGTLGIDARQDHHHLPERVGSDSISVPDDGRDQLEDLSASFLQVYGSTGQSPQRDLTDVWQMIAGFRMILKDSMPSIADNASLVRALLGENSARIRLLAPGFPFLTEQKELVDRWGTPLFFHVVSGGNIAVRSAGLDRTFWTADDLKTGPEADPIPVQAGSYSQNPPSLQFLGLPEP